MSPSSGSKVLAAQGVIPQPSSLMNIPRYLIEGALEIYSDVSRYKAYCLLVGTSDNQYNGDTPIASDRANVP